MRRTTDQWEALLDGITPGEWSVEIYHEDEYSPAAILTVDGDMLAWCSYGEDPTALMIPEDAALASVAPEAVAEVIRLRREIDGVRKFVEHFPLSPPLIGTGSTEARAYELQEKVSHALTRILEGDSDE